jgi:hypothetical protein
VRKDFKEYSRWFGVVKKTCTEGGYGAPPVKCIDDDAQDLRAPFSG